MANVKTDKEHIKKELRKQVALYLTKRICLP
jgi:hypothetical protein